MGRRESFGSGELSRSTTPMSTDGTSLTALSMAPLKCKNICFIARDFGLSGQFLCTDDSMGSGLEVC